MKPSDFITKRLVTLFERYKAAGGTQKSLAAVSGISQGQISVWLRGGVVPGADSLYALAQGFKVSISEFFPPETAAKTSSVEQATRSPLFGRVVSALTTLDETQLRRVEGFIGLLVESDDDTDLDAHVEKKSHRTR